MSDRPFRRYGLILLAATCVLSACGGGEGGASGPTSSQTLLGGGTAFAPTPTPAPTPAPTPTPTPTSVAAPSGQYDASIGLGVDAAGFANLPLRSGARRFFISSVAGSDARSCSTAENPGTPLASLTAGVACITRGQGDQILVAEGSTFATGLPVIHYLGGFSAAYPTVIESYDPADPANTSKYGKSTSNRPKVMTACGTNQFYFAGDAANGNQAGDSYIAVRGLAFGPTTDTPNCGVSLTGSPSYMLIENNIFRYTGFGANAYSGEAYGSNFIVRRNSFLAPWSATNAMVGQGLFIGDTSATIEDNVFYHTGWSVNAARTDLMASGGLKIDANNPNVWRHSLYAAKTSNVTVRRNVIIKAAVTGLSMRGDAVAYDNLLIQNPIAMAMAADGDYATARPGGVNQHAYNNMFLLAENINDDNGTRHWGFVTNNGKNGNSFDHNLMLASGNTAASQALQVEARIDVPSYMLIDSNKILNWASPSTFYYASGGYATTQVHATFTNNLWDNFTSGSNTQTTTASLPNAYTAATLAVAMGYANVDELGLAAVERPDRNWALNAKVLLGTGYAMTWAP